MIVLAALANLLVSSARPSRRDRASRLAQPSMNRLETDRHDPLSLRDGGMKMPPMHPTEWHSIADVALELHERVQSEPTAGKPRKYVGDSTCGILVVAANSSTCRMGIDDSCARQVLAGRRINWLQDKQDAEGIRVRFIDTTASGAGWPHSIDVADELERVDVAGHSGDEFSVFTGRSTFDGGAGTGQASTMLLRPLRRPSRILDQDQQTASARQSGWSGTGV